MERIVEIFNNLKEIYKVIPGDLVDYGVTESDALRVFKSQVLNNEYQPGHYLLGTVSFEELELESGAQFGEIKKAYLEKGYSCMNLEHVYLYIDKACVSATEFFPRSSAIIVMMNPVAQYTGILRINELGGLEKIDVSYIPEKRILRKRDSDILFLSLKYVAES